MFVKGNSDLGETPFSLEDFVIRMEPDSQTSTSFASSKIVCPQMIHKSEDKELANKEYKQLDPGEKEGGTPL